MGHFAPSTAQEQLHVCYDIQRRRVKLVTIKCQMGALAGLVPARA